MNSQITESEILERVEEARKIIELGIKQFNNGDLHIAIENFKRASEVSRASIPSYLYFTLSKYTLILESKGLENQEIKQETEMHIQDMITSLQECIDVLKDVLNRL